MLKIALKFCFFYNKSHGLLGKWHYLDGSPGNQQQRATMAGPEQSQNSPDPSAKAEASTRAQAEGARGEREQKKTVDSNTKPKRVPLRSAAEPEIDLGGLVLPSVKPGSDGTFQVNLQKPNVNVEKELDPSKQKAQEIPPEIQTLAKSKGLALESVKQQGGMWIACGETTCVPLGKVEVKAETSIPIEQQLERLPIGSKIIVNDPAPGQRSEFVLSRVEVSSGGTAFGLPAFGTFTRNPGDEQTYRFDPMSELKDSLSVELPAQSKGSAVQANQSLSQDAELAREYILSHPDQEILLVASVPELCEPCRKLQAALPGIVQGLRKQGNDIQVIEVSYDSFEEAKADFGQQAKFPLSVLFRAGDRSDTTADNPLPRGPVYEGVGAFQQTVEGMPRDYVNALRGLFDLK